MNDTNPAGTLFLCPTPIGNLEDITLRVISTLSSADIIAAEDTRRTLKLLNHLGIKKPLISYYEHNKKTQGGHIIDRLLSGENVALVSDAGTPAISDPGEDLVKLCIENNIKIEALPGASALITALISSGLATGRFTFEGFLSTNKKNRKRHLESVANDPRTLIFYEAPHKLKSTLSDMLKSFGDRRITISRELTKKFEEINRTTISAAIEKYEEVTPKGEFVLVVEGVGTNVGDDARIVPQQQTVEHLLSGHIAQGLSGNDAAKVIAKRLGVPKREIYEVYLKME